MLSRLKNSNESPAGIKTVLPPTVCAAAKVTKSRPQLI
jgi:hypothetical protein